MSKNKLAKFAEMEHYPHVFQAGSIATATEPHPMRGAWHTFFGNHNPIVLELGCGRGEYTVGLARLFPDKNFIGVDIKGARMWTGATESLREGLSNVAFLRTHIEFIQRFFAPGEVSEIWLTFSDPQMKKATKRLTSTYFLARYREFLQPSGLIHLKTDSQFLFTYTRCMVQENGLPMPICTDDLYATLPGTADDVMRRILSIQTYYEQQWMQRGIAIKYLQFRLPAEGALHEPDVEIELDNYRSYNRHKRSSLTTSR